MGNVQTSEQELEEAEKGIVIGTRHDEISNPSSPHSANDILAHKQQSEYVSDSGPTAAGGDDLVFTEVPKPPDGGYGWVIVLASFVCNTIVDGIAYSFGIFMPALVEYFGETTARVAWAGSLLNGVYLLVGPVASGLTNAYGFRTVSIAGSVLASAAFFLSTLVSNVSQLLFVYGIMGGIGLGLIYLPAIVAVNYYFETRRALATGIAVCGSGVGTFLFAPLASFLISMYGWRDANLIFGGVILICVLCGLLMRPLVYKKPDDSQKPLLQLMAEERMREMQRGSIVSDNYFLVKLPDGTLERRPKWKMNPDPGVHSSLALNEYGTSPIGLPTITEAARTGSSSSPEEGRANGVVSLSLPDSKMLRPPTAAYPTIPAPSPQQNGGTAPASSSTTSTPRADEDSEKSSDSEKNDVVPELPTGEDRELSRIGSSKRPSSRRGSVPIGESTSSREVVIIKNVSTPLFETSGGSGRRASSGPRAVQPNSSGSSLTMDLRRYSVQNRCSVSGTAPDDVWLCSSTNMSVTSRSSRGSIPRAGDMLRPMSRRDIFYSGSIYHLPQFQSQRSVASYRASVFSMPPHHSSVLQEQAKPGCCHLSMNCSVLKDMLDASLLKSPLFLLICLSNVFGMLGFYVPFVYLVDSAVAKGVKQESAAFLLSVIGITNTLGRVGCGYITDFPCVDALFVSNICIMLSGICTISFPFCFSYTSFVLAALAFGFFVAGYIALTSVMLVDLMGIEKLSNSFGLLILFRGASSMLGPPIAGALKDATGDYDASFYAAGVLLIMASLCGFLVPWLRRCVHRSEEDDEEDVGDFYGGQDHYSSTHQCPASASFINSSEKEASGSPMTAL